MALKLDFEFRYQTTTPRIALRATNALTGDSIEFRAIIDTGALLDASIAEDLGIDLSSAPSMQISGVGGSNSEAKMATIEIVVLEYPTLSAVLEVSFAPGIARSVGNFFGLNALSHFDFGLLHANSTGYLGRAQI